MKITKGTVLKIKHQRKGTFFAVAREDFNESDKWYPVNVVEGFVEGRVTDWDEGEPIPCKASLCQLL